jgi:hypothetical protein
MILHLNDFTINSYLSLLKKKKNMIWFLFCFYRSNLHSWSFSPRHHLPCGGRTKFNYPPSHSWYYPDCVSVRSGGIKTLWCANKPRYHFKIDDDFLLNERSKPVFRSASIVSIGNALNKTLCRYWTKNVSYRWKNNLMGKHTWTTRWRRTRPSWCWFIDRMCM